MEPRNIRIKVTAQYRREGSVIAGDARAWCDYVKTELELDCDEPPHRVSQLIRMAEASCYTIGTIRNPTPVELSATVNGSAFDVAEGPAPARDS